MTDITVAICTWNRSNILKGTLQAVANMEVPEGATWEVLVIDNNSTDNTKSVIQGFASTLPIRYYLESKQGIAPARNAVLKQSNGSLIVWLDDDCRPESKHLHRYWEAAKEWPDAVLFSGGIEPEFEEEPPRWIADNLDVLAPVYGQLIRTDPTRRLKENESVFSGNIATRSSIKEYKFDESLGRSKGERLGGEEIDLFMRIQQDRKEVVWVKDIIVRHFISKSAINIQYVFNSFHSEGRLRVRLYGNDSVATLFGYPRWVLRRLVSASATRLLYSWRRGRRWLIALRTVAEMKGILAEVNTSIHQ